MITGSIKDMERYRGISGEIAEALTFLKTVRYGENPSKFTVNFSEAVPSDTDGAGNPKIFEAHRKYIDLHYIMEGAEQFGYANIGTLTPVTEYDETGDYIFLKGEGSRLTLRAGDFLIAFPEDAHIPALKSNQTVMVKRAVVKIPV